MDETVLWKKYEINYMRTIVTSQWIWLKLIFYFERFWMLYSYAYVGKSLLWFCVLIAKLVTWMCWCILCTWVWEGDVRIVNKVHTLFFFTDTTICFDSLLFSSLAIGWLQVIGNWQDNDKHKVLCQFKPTILSTL